MIKVEEARELFKIEKFPSNFFELKIFTEYVNENRILIFKESIGKLSGFIGYGENELAIICINYNRPIGHQNFTFAHELGHWMLHQGISFSDDDRQISYSNKKYEKEANDFASELLYPNECFVKDYEYIRTNDLLSSKKRKEFAEYIDGLCHKYCMSYEAILNRILYKAKLIKSKNKIKKEIVKELGKNWSEHFDSNFYTPKNHELKEYQKSCEPYTYMNHILECMLERKEISEATAEAIRLKNGLDFFK